MVRTQSQTATSCIARGCNYVVSISAKYCVRDNFPTRSSVEFFDSTLRNLHKTRRWVFYVDKSVVRLKVVPGKSFSSWTVEKKKKRNNATLRAGNDWSTGLTLLNPSQFFSISFSFSINSPILLCTAFFFFFLDELVVYLPGCVAISAITQFRWVSFEWLAMALNRRTMLYHSYRHEYSRAGTYV